MYDFALLLSAVFWGVCLAIYLSRPYASIFHPATFYLAFHALVFVVRPIVARIMDYRAIYEFYEFMPSPSDKLTVIFGSMLGLATFLMSCMWSAPCKLEFPETADHRIERSLVLKPFVVVALACAPVAVWSLVSLYGDALAGRSDMIRDKATGIAINTTGNGYFKDAQFMLIPLGASLAWLLRFRWWAIAPIGAFILYRAATGARGAFVVAVMSVVLLYLYDKKERWPKFGTGGVLVALLFGFSLIGEDRGAGLRKVLSQGFQPGMPVYREGVSSFMAGMDFANLEYFEYLVYAIPGRTGTFGYFLNNLAVFTEPIPRVLWSGKPIGPPIQLYNLFDYGFPLGMTNSLPGEGWAQLGWAGIIIWCALAGWFFGWVYRKFATSRQSSMAVLAYLLFLPSSILAFRDGALVSVLKANFFLFVPLVFLLLLKRAMGIPQLGQISISRRWQGTGSPVTGRVSPADRRKSRAAQWNG